MPGIKQHPLCPPCEMLFQTRRNTQLCHEVALVPSRAPDMIAWKKKLWNKASPGGADVVGWAICLLLVQALHGGTQSKIQVPSPQTICFHVCAADPEADLLPGVALADPWGSVFLLSSPDLWGFSSSCSPECHRPALSLPPVSPNSALLHQIGSHMLLVGKRTAETRSPPLSG